MNIKIQSSSKHFSSFGGLFLFNQLMGTLPLRNLVGPFLPLLKSGNARSIAKFEDLLRGFAAGAQCLEDMDYLAKDTGFQEACGGKTYTSKTFGDYLRSFVPAMFSELNQCLAKLSWHLRSQVSDSKECVFDFDSTLNQQYGLKMEGVETNYRKFKSLYTMHVYDELGFTYHHSVRPGATHTSHDISGIIHRLISGIGSKTDSVKIRARADSGYCNQYFINACYAKNIEYVVGFKKHDNFQTIVRQVQNWKPCSPKEDKAIAFYDGRACEVGSTNYRMSGCTQRSRIVIIRAKKPLPEGYKSSLIEDPLDYDYFAFATNISELQMGSEDLIRFYRVRGNAENFIKEAKHGFDLKHYPCQKLSANNAYGIIAAFAQTLMRYIALIDNKDKPHFSKAIRNKFLLLCCQVVRRGREVFFRFNSRVYEEVKYLMSKIRSFNCDFT